MKKLLLMIPMILLITDLSRSQNNYNWITPNKTYLKMYVAEDGMYRINRTDFSNAGINTATIDPRTVKVYNKGIQIPVYFSGQQDGTFDSGDYFDFYGKRNDGGTVNVYDHLNNLSYVLNEYYNEYSDTSTYWVDWGGANGLRFTDFAYSAGANYPSAFFTDAAHFEKEYFYSQGENYSSSDLRFLTTEKYRAEGWLWSKLPNTASLSEPFDLPMLSLSPQNATFRILCYPTQRNTSVVNEHTIELRVNNNLIATIQTNDANRIDSTVAFPSSLLLTSGNTISVKYTHVAGFTSFMNVDLMEIKYPRRFALQNNMINANLGGADTASKRFSISQATNAQPVFIYDVVNNKRITSHSFAADTLKFTANGNARLLVVNNNITKKPFRIKQRVVPDLVSSSNGADYLVIYHNSLSAQAEQLRAYRQTRDGYRSVKTEIEDIYDIFNYGNESPVAVRYFTKHVYDNWQLPRLSYICLFGRASLDPKKNLSTSSYYMNLVPTYGYPPSDGYFANFNIGTFCYYTQVGLGRIPAYSSWEAQTIVDKIIAYESQSPARWTKDYIYVTGGGTLNEQTSHQTKSNVDILSLITPPSLTGNPVKVYRTDVSGVVSYNVKDSLRRSMDRGAAFLNYRGHAGSHDWEIAMNDPNTLNNGTRLPFILSLTCFTGENSLADYRGFGERFLYLPQKGSIGFIGTTGWSYAQNGNEFGTHITTTIKNDTNRRLGSIVRYANQVMSRDSLSFAIRHTLNCYALIGDPASQLVIPKQPELSISQQNCTLSNPFPAVGENLTVTIYPQNFGLNCDSTKVRFHVRKDNNTYDIHEVIARNLKDSVMLSHTFSIDSLGNFDVQVTLDQENWTQGEVESNNSVIIDIPLKNYSYVPLKPVANAVVQTDSVTFTGLNPRISSSGNSIKLIVQVDTALAFNSPALRTFNTTSVSSVATSFTSIVPARVNNTLHYWRTNAVINGDSTGWSSVQHFIYQSGAMTSGSRSGGSESTPQTVDIIKSKSQQFPQHELSNVSYQGGGIVLNDIPATLFIRSYGSNAEEASYFSVGDKNVYIDGLGINAGLNLLKVKKLTGSILEFKNLKMNNLNASNDSLLTFLNTFDSTHYLMLLNAAYFAGGQTLNSATKSKLRQFGSVHCDSIGLLSYFHTWSFIGWLGANSSQTSEMFDPCCRPAPGCYSCDHWTESISMKEVNFRKTTGTVNNIVGPARQWNSFSWTQTVPANSGLKFDVYGIDALDGQQYLLFSDITSNNFADLSFVNSIRYPKLNLVAKFSIDTVNGNSSPMLSSIKVNYVPAAEVVWDANYLDLNTTFKVGELLKFTTNLSNIGYSDIPGLIVNVYKKSVSEGNLIYSDTSVHTLQAGSSEAFSRKFTIPYYRDSMNAIVRIGLYDKLNEFYTFNNDIVIPMKSASVYRPVNVQIYSDGVPVNSGDFVSKNPELRIETDHDAASASLLTDTMRVSLYVNERYIPYNTAIFQVAELKRSEKESRQSSTSHSGSVFYPSFETGSNKISVVIRTDEFASDTVSFDVNVSDVFTVTDLYNYPNPMKSETNFMFTLTGALQPESVRIRIYTVGGRMIRELSAPAVIGNNSIPWDGTDQDGDAVANGTYIYRLITSDGVKSQAVQEKLVILK